MKLFEKGELKLLWPFYFQALFGSIFYIYTAFSIPYFLKLGFNLTQIGIIAAVLAISLFIFQIPTGIIADLIGRKKMLRFGYLFTGILFSLLFFFKDFYIILLLFVLLGFTQSLISGKDESWVVDLLLHEKRKDLIKDYYNKLNSILYLGAICSGIIGAILVKSFGLPIFLLSTGFAYLSGFFVFSFGKESFINNKKKIHKYFFNHTKKSFRYILHNKNLLLLILIAAFVSICSSFSGSNMWNALFTKIGLKDYWFGYLFSAVSFFGFVIPLLNKKIVKKTGGEKKFFIFILSFISLISIMVILFNSIFVLILLFLLYSSLFFSYNPVRGYFFQNLISGKMRTTILGINNTFIQLVSALSLPLAGFAADKLGIKFSLLMGGLILIPSIILVLKIKKK
ncbi:Major Facilitator Superfamily protein [uncultured archaeon]|nr:Major Facilitator Superfamily protein [uncultured archaeon]